MKFVHIVCFRCKEDFGVSDATYETLKRSSQSFHCPWGHSQHFLLGPSESDKLRQERDRLAQRVAQRDDEIRRTAEQRDAAERRASAARGQVTRLKNRAKAGVCPCCNRSFVQLRRHMDAKHPGFTAEEVSPEGVTAH